MSRACLFLFTALALPVPSLLAQGTEVTKESLYRDLDAEHNQYDKAAKALQEELIAVVKGVHAILEPENRRPDELNVAPRTPEQEKALADGQAKAQAVIDKLLDEELRHRHRVMELLDAGRGVMRAELLDRVSKGRMPSGTLRDLLMPSGEAGKVEVPQEKEGDAAANAKKKGLLDESDDENEGIQ